MPDKKYFALLIFVIVFTLCFCPTVSISDDFDFNQLAKKFDNFIRCELTRTDAVNHFDGQPFQITMIDLFDVQQESDLKIITGAVQCFVGKSYHTLYAAVGVKSILGKEQVLYFTIRKKDFNILASELIRFPYKERCKWSEYWIDID